MRFGWEFWHGCVLKEEKPPDNSLVFSLHSGLHFLFFFLFFFSFGRGKSPIPFPFHSILSVYQVCVPSIIWVAARQVQAAKAGLCVSCSGENIYSVVRNICSVDPCSYW